MKTTKAMKADAKNARRGVDEQPSGAGKNKREKPVVVQYRWRPDSWIGTHWPKGNKWGKFGAYRDMETAEKAMADSKRKRDLYEFRIKPDKEDV